MGFGEAIRTVFGKYATFRGRARRSEYWYFYLFTLLIGLAAGIVDAVLVPSMGANEAFKNSGGPIEAVVNLALLLPSLAVTVRRLHDTNHSGWLLLGFVGYTVLAIVLFVVGVGMAAGGGGQPSFGSPLAIVGVVLLLGIFGFAIWLFVLMVSNGTPGENRFGSDPKGPSVDVFS